VEDAYGGQPFIHDFLQPVELIVDFEQNCGERGKGSELR
jgi:hypothetical protein